MTDYSKSTQNLALNFEESLGATTAPISQIVTSIIPDYRAMFEQAAAEKKRRHARNRQQRHRTSRPAPTLAVLVAKLRKGTANPGRDKLLEQIRGQEAAIALFYIVSSLILAKSGPISDAKLAVEYERETGVVMTRNSVYRMRQRIGRLREPGRPWSDL